MTKNNYLLQLRRNIEVLYNLLHHSATYYTEDIDPGSYNILTVLSDVFMNCSREINTQNKKTK